MSIYLFCPKCKRTDKLGAKKCRSCGANFPTTAKEYRVMVYFQGQTVTKVVDSLDFARRLEIKIKAELQEGRYFDAHTRPATFGELFQSYVEGKKNIIAEKQVQLMRVRYGLYIEGTIGKSPLASIKPAHIEKIKTILFNTTVHGHKLSPTTIKRVIDLVSSVFIYAHKFHGYRGENPCEVIERPKINNEIIRYLTPEQKSNLAAVLDSWPDKTIANFYRFLLLGGFRTGEAQKLTWQYVDLERRIVKIIKPKSGKDQYRAISSAAVEVLLNQRELTPTSTIVFPSPITGGPLTTTKHSWYTIRQLAGIPPDFRIHDLRHNFGTELATGGVQQKTIAALLGHTQLKTTERYVHAVDPALRAAVDIIKLK